jgi:probable O-glycosylation ligase (exosortase A-associated)
LDFDSSFVIRHSLQEVDMKQTILMIALTLIGTVGVVISPFLGVAVYYLFAVLRPQYMWEWALPPGIPWSYYVALAVMLAAVARVIAENYGPERGRRVLSRGHLAVLAFGAWVGVAFVMARDRQAALPWVEEYAKIFVMFAASAVLIRSVRQVWLLLVMTVVALAYIAYEVNFLYLAYGYLGIQSNGYGGVDNNGAGLMLAMAVPLCYFAWEGSTSRLRWAFLAFIPVLLHAVLMTYSRGAMVSLLIVMPLLWWRSRHRGELVLAAIPLMVMLAFMAGPEIRARFFSISTYDDDASAQSRFQGWEAGLGIVKDNPVFGVGPRNANLFTYQYGADMQGRTIHNVYLQTAADMGLVGAGLYLTAYATVWLGLNRLRRKSSQRRDAEGRQLYAMAAAVECALAVFCVGSLFLSVEVLELPYLMLLLGGQLTLVAPATVSTTVPRRVVRTALAPQAA